MTYPHTATTERLVVSGNKHIYQSLGTSKCFLQPLDNESADLLNYTYSKGSYCYMPITTDILMSDRVTVNGTVFTVKGVKILAYGSLAHKRVLLEEKTV